MAIPSISGFIGLVRRVDRLFDNVDKTQKGLEALSARHQALEDRMTRMESHLEMVIVEARSAAGTAASTVAVQTMSDLARRIGALEATVEQQREQLRLSGPR